jgi:micrococcal nuclease
MGVLSEKRVANRRTSAFALVATLIIGMAALPSFAAKNFANPLQCPAEGSRVVGFARAIDGAGFVTGEGEEVRLAGVLAPGAGGEAESQTAADAARDALDRALRGRTVSIAGDEPSRDRYGRTLAQVFASATWVQRALLEAGDIRAAPDAASGPCAKPLLEAEAVARANRLAHWRTGVFRVRSPDELRSRLGSFQIVEGKVVTASVTRGRAYINFGADYRSDFTVTVTPEDVRQFRQAKFDIPGLAGKRVRVRGWVEFYNGPEITIASPDAIEVLD